uniref:Type II restriction enzyme HgiDI n=1 Tax=Herpetosiphon aurantiacus TaxID=65 RepID=T2D1_HERAU|nr:RecName: Full=Type II restriction enzyme HgiDI; Short=R.HgiDI; AltName: Full=Endonuclease HgiDI; AltName: Full=Type-2 restriction enzyme HgiDI [Herpetosiphon aurantiacus]CAA38937.1 restriction enzyme [Herpetosiphon giganteus]
MFEQLNQPGLFGITNSNRDFTKKEAWGKNQFNNAFPIALACFMFSQNIKPIYIRLEKRNIEHNYFAVDQVFQINPLEAQAFFAFEHSYHPYTELIIGKTPAIDVVISNLQNSQIINAFEIKLTAIPDNTTANLPDNLQGCEIVIRPDTIVYLALSIAKVFQQNPLALLDILDPVCARIGDWEDATSIQPMIPLFCELLYTIFDRYQAVQIPILLQPIWKTQGKLSILHENCLDLFVWSNFALAKVFLDASIKPSEKSITRPERTTVWLIKMLYDFAQNGKIDYKRTLDRITFNLKNDKAFAASGMVTRKYMNSPELQNPRIKRHSIKHIIINGGQRYLSPERRLDSAIVSTPGLFEEIL